MKTILKFIAGVEDLESVAVGAAREIETFESPARENLAGRTVKVAVLITFHERAVAGAAGGSLYPEWA